MEELVFYIVFENNFYVIQKNRIQKINGSEKNNVNIIGNYKKEIKNGYEMYDYIFLSDIENDKLTNYIDVNKSKNINIDYKTLGYVLYTVIKNNLCIKIKNSEINKSIIIKISSESIEKNMTLKEEKIFYIELNSENKIWSNVVNIDEYKNNKNIEIKEYNSLLDFKSEIENILKNY